MKLEACIARREFDKFGGKRGWFELFRQVEAGYPLGPYDMSGLSELLLERAFDYPAIQQTRRQNYRHLAESLSEYAIFRRLDEDTVPLGFPIRVERRDEVRQFLFDHEVFPPIHWCIGDCVPPQFIESHRLSAQIMTIPCDQRLNSDDVQRVSDLVRIALRSR